jgi:hypothetical protein
MTPSQLPLFVPRGGEQVYGQPVELRQTNFRGFLLAADEVALQALCDRYLNEPTGRKLHYRPLLPRVVLGVARIGRVSSALPPDRDKGYITEYDVAFWVPIAATKTELGLTVASQVAWFLPYVFVDNAWGTAAGREIYGFPKETATVAAPRDAGGREPYTVDTLAIERFGPDVEARPGRVLEVSRVDAGGDEGHVWKEVKELISDFWEMLFDVGGGASLPGFEEILEFGRIATVHAVPLVFLRQFRDVADGRRACYQSVVEAQARVLHFHGAGHLPGDYRLKVGSFESHPIVRELGLSGPEPDALAAWYADFDFILENGRELWRAP